MVTQRVVELLRLRRSWIALGALALLAMLAWLVYRPAVAQEDVVVKAYPCPAGQAGSIAEHLREELGGAEGVRVAADSRTSQVVVQAPQSIQVWVAKRLAVNTEARAAATDAGAASNKAVQSRTVALRRIRTDQLETSLRNLLQDRITPITSAGEQARAYRVSQASGDLLLSVDAANSQVNITGTGPAVDGAARLIEILDGPPEESRRVRVVPVRAAHFDDIQRAATAIRTVSDSASGTPSRLAYYQARNSAAVPTAVGPPSVAAPPGTGPGVPPGTEATPGAPGEGRGAGLVNPVQIEIPPGLDVMVIKGNPQDVALVEQFIKQVEQLSALTQPVIKIIPLRQVDCEQLALLIRTLYDEVYRTRQGDVSITPVITPNELLVVGRAENVKTVESLVEKLDQPAVPDAQFRVFQLAYATAATAQTAIQSFFASRGGLAPVVVATVDARTNALIVQASPRDMQQVAELISRLDTHNDHLQSEVRIIKLEHATASDVASILQSAIGAGTGGPVLQQGGAFGAQPQPQATGGTAGQRAAMIRFLTIDSRGRRLLNSGILSDIKITTDPRANALIVTAPAEDIELIETLVHQIDMIPAAEAQIKVFKIVNGDATDLSNMLDRLFGLPTTTQGAGGGQAGAFGQLVQTVTAGNEPSVVTLHFAVDVRTNSIIATGTMGDLNVVEAILTKLDDSDVRQRKSVVLRLKNSPAQDVANTLNTYLTTQRTFDQSAPGLTSVYEEFEREVVIVPEPVTNSLVLSATPRFFDEVKGIIEQLDARPLMVTIQVLIASVDLGDTNEFGIEVGLQDSTLFDRSVLSNPVVTSTTLPTGTTTQTVIAANNAPGFNFNDTSNPLGNSGLGTNLSPPSVAGQSLTNFAVGRQNTTLGYGGLVLSAQSQNVSMLVRALAENHKIEILERPQITTLDNQAANVQIGQRVPTINSVSNNALTGQSNTITFQNVGVIMGVIPRISPDGLVVMQIDAEKSALEPEATGIPIFSSPTGQITRSPIIDTTTAQTTVSAMDGQTIVLGGLISKNKNESHRSVPWLGDLPLIGNLFRFDSTACERTELLIIMTPHIIRTASDAEALKREEAARMSWCLCDVTKIHGEAGLNPRGGTWGAADVKVVYPDSPEPINLPGEPVVPEAVPAPSGQPHAPAALPQPSNQPMAPVTPPIPVQTSPPAPSPVPPMPSTSPAPTATPVPSAGPVAPSPGEPISGGRQYGPMPAGDAPGYSPVRTHESIQPAVYQRQDAYNQSQTYPGPSQPAVYQQPVGPYQPQYYR
jgi:type II secretion system protein D